MRKYTHIGQLRKEVKAVLPQEAQEIFLRAYNVACDRGLTASSCFRYAWTMVHNDGYRKDRITGQWRKHDLDNTI